jgi:cytochrome c5
LEPNVKQLAVVLALLVSVAASADRVPPGTADEISARLAPAGELCKVGDPCGQASAPAAGGGAGLGLSGEAVYNQFCFACHTAGVGGAPKTHDVAAWEPRLAKGDDALLTSMLNGLNAMPPKGTCMGCSDDELKAALEFMSAAQ